MTSWQKNDGLRSIVPALTSSGISGLALNHADVGGFAGFWKIGGLFQMRRTRKLLQRHIELGAFSPVFRTHEGILPQRNAQVYDPELQAFYAKFSQIRPLLRPYLKALNQEASEKGWPMVRHLYLHYPTDSHAQKARYQYMLGQDMVVAPNLRRHARNIRVYLPKGQWKHWFSKKVYEGGRYYRIAAPLGQPPVFVRQGSRFQLL
jgi:alpha-glucosidase